MSYGFELVVPSIVETKLTGWIGGVRQERAKTVLEINFYVDEPRIRCQLDGKRVAWEKLPLTAQRKARDGLNMLASQFTA
jgi:hypothetical protein